MSIGPFWRYYGGKWRAAPRYPAPVHGLIVEPFAGAAGYACRYPDLDVLLIDLSPTIAGIWEWLIQATPDDVLAVPDVPEGGTVDDIDAPKAARDLVGFWCNNGAQAPRKSPSAWVRGLNGAKDPWGGHAWAGWSCARPKVAPWVARIKHWRIRCASYADVEDLEATWFVDPPYQTAAGRHYPFDDVDYAHLGEWVQSRHGQVIACDQQGADWLPWNGGTTLKAMKGKSAEVVYCRGGMPLFAGQQ